MFPSYTTRCEYRIGESNSCFLAENQTDWPLSECGMGLALRFELTWTCLQNTGIAALPHQRSSGGTNRTCANVINSHAPVPALKPPDWSTPYQTRTGFCSLKETNANPYTNGAKQAREESNPGSKFWRLLPRHAAGPIEWVDRRSNPVGTIFSRELYRISYLPARAPGENRTRLFDVGNVVCDQYTTGAENGTAGSRTPSS